MPTEIVSIHISGDMSGTFESAQLAARQVSVPVTTVDSRQVGIATGFAALTAADVLDAGGSAAAAVEAARDRAASSSSLFYVDTLEYLRRGGRIGAAAALFGGALAVKPLLTIADGRVSTLEKVRTSARALARLEDLAAERAGDLAVDVSVAHLADEDRAGQLADPAAGATRREPRRPRGLVRRARCRPGRARRPGHARGLRGPATRLRPAGRPHPVRPAGSSTAAPVRRSVGGAALLGSEACAATGSAPSTRRRSHGGSRCSAPSSRRCGRRRRPRRTRTSRGGRRRRTPGCGRTGWPRWTRCRRRSRRRPSRCPSRAGTPAAAAGPRETPGAGGDRTRAARRRRARGRGRPGRHDVVAGAVRPARGPRPRRGPDHRLAPGERPAGDGPHPPRSPAATPSWSSTWRARSDGRASPCSRPAAGSWTPSRRPAGCVRASTSPPSTWPGPWSTASRSWSE